MPDLNGLFCVFSFANGSHQRMFRLIENGIIQDMGNEGHDNERFWEFRDDFLILKSIYKQETSRFKIQSKQNDRIYWHGLYKGSIELIILSSKIRSNLFNLKTKYAHQEDIEKGFFEVGDNTYGSIELFDKHYGKVVIGDFCSIASHVKAIVGGHRTDLISTYPFKTLQEFYTDVDIKNDDHYLKGNIEIGNDVGIGCNSIIMSGVKIGSGAIVSSGSVVTKNVEPYAIVGGNPCKVLKFRIDDFDKRRKMLEISWWKWPESRIVENLNKIISTDIDAFISEFYHDNGATSVDNVVVYPYRINFSGVFEGGPIFDEVPDVARIKRKNGFADSSVINIESMLYTDSLKGEYLWGGPLFFHFGHIMTESIHRLYAFNSDLHDGIVFSASGFNDEAINGIYIPNFLYEILKLFSIPISKVYIIKSPTHVEKLIYVNAGSALNCGAEDWYLKLLKQQIEAKIEFEALKLDKLTFPEKIFMGRCHLTEGVVTCGIFIGESYFKKMLCDNGFVNLITENYSFIEQVMILKHAKQIVFTEGSQIYSAELLGKIDAKVAMIPRRSGDLDGYVAHLSKKTDFTIIGDENSVRNIVLDGNYVTSPGFSLNPKSIFNDLINIDAINKEAKFSMDDYLSAELDDLFNYCGRNHSKFDCLVEKMLEQKSQ